MYSALELHKEVLQGLQTVDAFSQDMFLPEEIDFHLNKQQDSFINELLDKGFADRQIRLDHIQTLLIKNKKLDVWISPVGFYHEDRAVNSFLPGNYKHNISIQVAVRETKDCDILVEKTIPKVYNYFTATLLSNLTTPPYFSKVELVQILEDQSERVRATVSLPVQEKEDIYFIVQSLLYQISETISTLNVYWEKYVGTHIAGVIAKNKFIFIDSNLTNRYKLNIYKPDGTLDHTVTPVVGASSVIETWDPDLLTDLKSSIVTSSILLDNKELYERRNNIFYTTKASSPHTLISNGLLFTYYSKSFIPEGITMDYIRQPQPISLALSQGCELSESAARIVANRTIEYLKLVIENPAYKEVAQRNETRDQV